MQSEAASINLFSLLPLNFRFKIGVIWFTEEWLEETPKNKVVIKSISDPSDFAFRVASLGCVSPKSLSESREAKFHLARSEPVQESVSTGYPSGIGHS